MMLEPELHFFEWKMGLNLILAWESEPGTRFKKRRKERRWFKFRRIGSSQFMKFN